MFYNTSSAGGHVNCELLQTTDFGASWQRVGEEGEQFIPRGEEGEFDSHTIYTAWGGDRFGLTDPADNDTQLFFYAGGNGPHSGARDDSIGLARGKTHANTGLRPGATTGRGEVSSLRTAALSVGCQQPELAVLASLGAQAARRVRVLVDGLALQLDAGGSESDERAPRWFPLMRPPGPAVAASAARLEASLAVQIDTTLANATFHAVRASC